MKSLLALVVLGFVTATSSLAQAPDKYLVFLRGSAAYTNSSGRFVSKTITDRTILQDAARSAGLADTKGLSLVYHFQSGLGDTLDIVDSSSGQVYQTVLGFYFGQDFGRVGLTNSAGTQEKHLDYVYTGQNSHSLGSALITKTFFRPASTNQPTRVTVQGTYQYLVTPEAGQGAKICTGSFRTLRPFVPRNP